MTTGILDRPRIVQSAFAEKITMAEGAGDDRRGDRGAWRFGVGLLGLAFIVAAPAFLHIAGLNG